MIKPEWLRASDDWYNQPGGIIRADQITAMVPDSKPSCGDLIEEVHSHVPPDAAGPRTVSEEERDRA